MANVLPPIPWDKPQTSFEWVDWFTKLRKIIDTSALDHQSLLNIQGGNSSERYHLSAADAAKVPNAEQTSNKGAFNGYASLNGGGRMPHGVDTTSDVIIDLASKGLVLKDTQATPHYWRVTISTTGVLTTTDLGTLKP